MATKVSSDLSNNRVKGTVRQMQVGVNLDIGDMILFQVQREELIARKPRFVYVCDPGCQVSG